MEQLPYESLAQDILAMAAMDQNMREKHLQTGIFDDSVDRSNRERLKQILAVHGWPTISFVGKEAASAAWLLAQHADSEPDFQLECLSLMKEIPEGEISLKDLAFFEDRVLMNTGQPQKYGTQFRMSKDLFGPLPIADPAAIDLLRANAGLNTFEEYTAQMKVLYIRYQENKKRARGSI